MKNGRTAKAKPIEVPSNIRHHNPPPFRCSRYNTTSTGKIAQVFVAPASPKITPAEKILVLDEVNSSPSKITNMATRQKVTRYGSISIVWDACSVEEDIAIIAVPSVWRKADRFLSISATRTTFTKLIRSVKTLANSMASFVPTVEANTAKGASRIVISGGCTRAKSL